MSPVYRAVTLPTGATFDEETGRLSFTPTELQLGEQLAIFESLASDQPALVLPLLVQTSCDALSPTQLSTVFLFNENEELEGLELRFSRPLLRDQDWSSAPLKGSDTFSPFMMGDPLNWVIPMTTDQFLTGLPLMLRGEHLLDELGCPVDVDGDGFSGGELSLSADDLFEAYDKIEEDYPLQYEQFAGSTPIQLDITVQGSITTAGEEDVFTFVASANQNIFFDIQQYTNVASNEWRCLAPNGTQLFRKCLGCGDPGVMTMPISGTYTLIVGKTTSTQTGTYQFRLWNVSSPQSFAIQVGNTISNGVPGAGAGNIETPGVKDIYTFTASANQSVFFDTQGSSSGFSINAWECRDQNGLLVFSNCFGCGDPGVYTLAGGTYTITVGSNTKDEVGTYQFKLWNVPAAQSFAIQVGSTVSNGVPGAGAGNIETPGVMDIYSFTVTAGMSVFFDILTKSSGVSPNNWECRDPNGLLVFQTCLGCGDPGVKTLAIAGTYTIKVGSNSKDNVGTYSFKVWSVPSPQTFAIQVGNTVANGTPAPGAGNIESPGAKDNYTFIVTPGASVYFDAQSYSGISSLVWKCTDANGTQIFSKCLGCGDPGSKSLSLGGTYTIAVGSNTDDGVGAYQFQIR